MIIIISKKENYYMDEIWSYRLSNHQLDVAFKEGKYESPKEIIYKNFLVVNINSRFNYYKL